MNRLVLLFVLLPALALLTAAGALFLFAPDQVAELAANSVDMRLVQPWRVGVTLLLLAAPLLIAVIYAGKTAIPGNHLAQQGR